MLSQNAPSKQRSAIGITAADCPLPTPTPLLVLTLFRYCSDISVMEVSQCQNQCHIIVNQKPWEQILGKLESNMHLKMSSVKRWPFCPCLNVCNSPNNLSNSLIIDCYTVVALWQQHCQWGMRHGLQLAGITLLWLVGLNIPWDCLVSPCIMGSCDQWKFSSFFQTPVTVALHSPDGRQMTAVRAVRGDCERV